MYLLDTNVVSELRKSRAGKADHGVAQWADSVDAAELFVSVITLQELEIGVLLAENRDPPGRGRSCAAGSTAMCCPHSSGASCRSMPPWHCAAHGCMYRTCIRFAML